MFATAVYRVSKMTKRTVRIKGNKEKERNN